MMLPSVLHSADYVLSPKLHKAVLIFSQAGGAVDAMDPALKATPLHMVLQASHVRASMRLLAPV